MKETINVNALVEGFHIMYRDFLGMPEINNFVD
jgi:hypothetical protein